MDERVELIPIKFEKLLQAKNYTGIILGTDEKKFAIYTTPENGKILQRYLTSGKKERPLTHDLILQIFRGLEIRLKQVVIYHFKNTHFEARLFIEQTCGDTLNIVEMDARPSDCIALALTHKVPLYSTKEVFDTSVAYVE